MASAALTNDLLASLPATTATHATETLVFSVLVQLVIMIAAARLMNTLFRQLGQPGVTGEIVAGLLLGPSLFGTIFPGLSLAVFGAKPAEPIVILSQIGLLLLMFQIGTNFEFGHIRKDRNLKGLAIVTLASVAVPFGLGLLLGLISAPAFAGGIDPLIYALFCGVAMCITAVPILGRILHEFGLNRHETGVLAISAAALNDVIGWVLLAGVSALAVAAFAPLQAALQVAGLGAFGLICWLVLRPAVHWLLRAFPLRPDGLSPDLLAIVLGLIIVLGMCTYALGIFAIFGGFAAGLLFHHDAKFVEAWQRQVGRFVLVFFLPVFFTFTGLRTNVLGLNTGTDLIWLAIILATAILGKIIPVYLAGRVSGYGHHPSMLLGVLMNTRALMELVVLNIGYELGFIPQKIFTMFVIMAVVTTIMTGPLLRLILPRMGHAIPKGIEA